jgi:RNA polymerase sigma-70 factor (ECF subfamily)
MTAMHPAAHSHAPQGDAVHHGAGAMPERPSFRAVYETYFDFVWSCTRRLGVAPEAIDDVVQDIFVVVYGRLETLERPGSIRSWLYGIVRRTVSTYRRSRNVRERRESPDPAVEEHAGFMQPSPLDLAVLSDEVKLLWRLLEQVDAPKREVLVLAELEEMTMPEIAHSVGIPLNTAYSRLRAARQDFNVAFSRHIATSAAKSNNRPAASNKATADNVDKATADDVDKATADKADGRMR